MSSDDGWRAAEEVLIELKSILMFSIEDGLIGGSWLNAGECADAVMDCRWNLRFFVSQFVCLLHQTSRDVDELKFLNMVRTYFGKKI